MIEILKVKTTLQIRQGEKYATSELMKQYDVTIWVYHGMFCSREDFDLMFGLMYTVEILVKILSMRLDKLQTITLQNCRDLAVDFRVILPEKSFL